MILISNCILILQITTKLKSKFNNWMFKTLLALNAYLLHFIMKSICINSNNKMKRTNKEKLTKQKLEKPWKIVARHGENCF